MDGGGGKKPVAQLRFALRKAFAECDEIVFSWEEASVQTLQVLRSLLNATERMNDFVAAEGKLGVLSAIPDAENNLKVREAGKLWRMMKLVQSMERLRNAARSLLESFPELCVKVENLVDTTLSQQKELQAACTVEELWEAEHKAQPSIAQMLEWVYDVQVELRKELGLRYAYLPSARQVRYPILTLCMVVPGSICCRGSITIQSRRLLPSWTYGKRLHTLTCNAIMRGRMLSRSTELEPTDLVSLSLVLP
eukprot:543851-Rhodomonas_salina.2